MHSEWGNVDLQAPGKYKKNVVLGIQLETSDM